MRGAGFPAGTAQQQSSVHVPEQGIHHLISCELHKPPGFYQRYNFDVSERAEEAAPALAGSQARLEFGLGAAWGHGRGWSFIPFQHTPLWALGPFWNSGLGCRKSLLELPSRGPAG